MKNKSINLFSPNGSGRGMLSGFNMLRSISRKLILLTGILSLFFVSACKMESYDYTGEGYETVVETVPEAPYFNIYRPTDLAAVKEDMGKPLPVIVWANGGCFRSAFTWAPLFKRWAAEGYVVLALSPAGDAFELDQTTVADQGKLIDWAFDQSKFADMLDADRIVAAGNSCGGITSLGLAAKDPRVATVFVLSGSSAIGSTNKNIMGKINVPVGYVIGGPGDIAGAPARNDYNALPDGVPAMVVNRVMGDHVTVSTTVDILEEIADISFHWMDLALNGSQASYEELMMPEVCSDCTPGDWVLTSKNLDTLLQ